MPSLFREVTIFLLNIVAFTLQRGDYHDIEQVDKVTAQISQRTLLLILPLVFASFVTGTVAVFEQVGMMIMTMDHGDNYDAGDVEDDVLDNDNDDDGDNYDDDGDDDISDNDCRILPCLESSPS